MTGAAAVAHPAAAMVDKAVEAMRAGGHRVAGMLSRGGGGGSKSEGAAAAKERK